MSSGGSFCGTCGADNDTYGDCPRCQRWWAENPSPSEDNLVPLNLAPPTTGPEYWRKQHARLPSVLREHVTNVLACEAEPHVIADAVSAVEEAANLIESLITPPAINASDRREAVARIRAVAGGATIFDVYGRELGVDPVIQFRADLRALLTPASSGEREKALLRDIITFWQSSEAWGDEATLTHTAGMFGPIVNRARAMLAADAELIRKMKAGEPYSDELPWPTPATVEEPKV